MRISSVQTIAPVGMPAAPASLPAAPVATTADYPVPPAAGHYNKYGMDYLHMPGVTSVGWSASPGTSIFDQFNVTVGDARSAAVLAGILEPEVNGIKVKLFVGRELYTGTTEASYRDRISAIAAMPGGWDHSILIGPRNGGRITFKTVTQAHAVQLDTLLKRDIPFGVGDHGQPTFLRIYWKPGVPA